VYTSFIFTLFTPFERFTPLSLPGRPSHDHLNEPAAQRLRLSDLPAPDDGASTRQAAADFSLSQTRVRQIAQHVARWLAQSLPPSCEATDAAYLRLALHIAADRLQLIYGDAMHGWRATHESKYAGIVLRVTAAMGKMPFTSGALDALIADTLEGPLSEDDADLASGGRQPTEAESRRNARASQPERATEPSPPPPTPHSSAQSAICNSQFAICNLQPAIPSSPPVRDCSPAPISPPAAAQPATPSPTVTPSPPTPSNTVPRTTSAARRAFLAPAQPVTDNADNEPITELKFTPQTLSFTTQKPMSRRDRRRLRRLTASK
jgi:hypothetical protein